MNRNTMRVSTHSTKPANAYDCAAKLDGDDRAAAAAVLSLS